jgi:uncharacterized membrane protein YgcG
MSLPAGRSFKVTDQLMPEAKVPYIQAYGNITKALQKIKSASTPDRFTQDFLATKLGLKGGSAKPVIPFLKRTGFLSSDGSPTSLYKRFRNPAVSGAAAAEALRAGFGALYEINEYAHDAPDEELKGIVVQATGLEEASSTVRAIVKSFRAIQAFADFDAAAGEGASDADGGDGDEGDDGGGGGGGGRAGGGGDRSINLGYTINLQLPATSDIAVFNAIFKSLREHILRD